MLICNTDQAKHDSNTFQKNWSILVIFQPLNVSQRKNPFFSLTARLGEISKIWKKRHKTGWFKTFSQNFRSVRCVSKALAALQHTYIHTYIHTYGLRNYFARSDCDFSKKCTYIPFTFTQTAIVHRIQQNMCHMKGDSLGIHIILKFFF